MNKTLIFISAILFATPVMAMDYSRPDSPHGVARSKGIQAYDARNDANVRLGTGCKLKIYGEDVYDGICNVGRSGDVTSIDTGVRTYKIVRDAYDNTEAVFYSGRDEIGTVKARGSCWTGPNVRYCAN